MHAQDCTISGFLVQFAHCILHTAVNNMLFLPLVFTLPSSACSSHECRECRTLTLTSFVCMYTKRRQCSTRTHCSHTYAMYSMWTPEQQGSREQIAADARLYTACSLYICTGMHTFIYCLEKLGVNSKYISVSGNHQIWSHQNLQTVCVDFRQ